MISEEKFEQLTRKPMKDWTNLDTEQYNDYCYEMGLVHC